MRISIMLVLLVGLTHAAFDPYTYYCVDNYKCGARGSQVLTPTKSFYPVLSEACENDLACLMFDVFENKAYGYPCKNALAQSNSQYEVCCKGGCPFAPESQQRNSGKRTFSGYSPGSPCASLKHHLGGACTDDGDKKFTLKDPFRLIYGTDPHGSGLSWDDNGSSSANGPRNVCCLAAFGENISTASCKNKIASASAVDGGTNHGSYFVSEAVWPTQTPQGGCSARWDADSFDGKWGKAMINCDSSAAGGCCIMDTNNNDKDDSWTELQCTATVKLGTTLVLGTKAMSCANVCHGLGTTCSQSWFDTFTANTMQQQCDIIGPVFGAGFNVNCQACSPNGSTNGYCHPGSNIGSGAVPTGGTIYTNGSGAYNCGTAPDNRITPVCPCMGDSSPLGPVQADCTAGQKWTGSTCEACPAGTYQTTAGQTTCVMLYTLANCSAGNGNFVAGNASTAASCNPCAAHEFSSTGTACSARKTLADCAAGNGNFVDGNVSTPAVCNPCAAHEFALAGTACSARITLADCDAGKGDFVDGDLSNNGVCNDCAAHEFALAGTACAARQTQADSPAGQGNFHDGDLTKDSTFTDCIKAAVSPWGGDFSLAGDPCSLQKVQAECGAGTYFVPEESNQLDATCPPCAAGHFSLGNALACTAHDTCTVAPAGRGPEPGYYAPITEGDMGVHTAGTAIANSVCNVCPDFANEVDCLKPREGFPVRDEWHDHDNYWHCQWSTILQHCRIADRLPEWIETPEIWSRLLILENRVTLIDNRVTINEGDITINEGDIDNNEINIDINAGDIARNTGDIHINIGDIDSNERDININEADINNNNRTLNIRIDDNRDDIDSNEIEIISNDHDIINNNRTLNTKIEVNLVKNDAQQITINHIYGDYLSGEEVTSSVTSMAYKVACETPKKSKDLSRRGCLCVCEDTNAGTMMCDNNVNACTIDPINKKPKWAKLQLSSQKDSVCFVTAQRADNPHSSHDSECIIGSDPQGWYLRARSGDSDDYTECEARCMVFGHYAEQNLTPAERTGR